MTEDEYLLGPDLLAAPVTTPGSRERSVWLPPGQWVDWWRSVRFEEPSGAYRPAGLRVLRGGRDATVPAPLGQPPLLLRAGAILPLLGADVDTLSPYGRDAGLVRMADRAGRLRLLAVPRGASASPLPDGGRAGSLERRRHWTLRLRGPSTRWSIEASLAALRHPFHPRAVLVNGRRLARKRWSYDRATRVLRLEVSGARLRVEVR